MSIGALVGLLVLGALLDEDAPPMAAELYNAWTVDGGLRFRWEKHTGELSVDSATPEGGGFVVIGEYAQLTDAVDASRMFAQPTPQEIPGPDPTPEIPIPAPQPMPEGEVTPPAVQVPFGPSAELEQYHQTGSQDEFWIATTWLNEYSPAAGQHVSIATWRVWRDNIVGVPLEEGVAGSRALARLEAVAWIDGPQPGVWTEVPDGA